MASRMIRTMLLMTLAPRGGRCPRDVVLWSNGDPGDNFGATVNEQATNGGPFNAYDNFTVTDPGGWTIDRAWSVDAVKITGITQAEWEIRAGMSPGNGGTIVASGIAAATQTALGVVATSLGYAEYTIQVTGLSVSLGPGTYWLSVSPLVGADPTNQFGGVYESYNIGTNGANAVGTPTGAMPDALFNTPTNSFQRTFTGLAMGVAGSVGAVPEPGSLALLGLGAFGLILRAGARGVGPRDRREALARGDRRLGGSLALPDRAQSRGPCMSLGLDHGAATRIEIGPVPTRMPQRIVINSLMLNDLGQFGFGRCAGPGWARRPRGNRPQSGEHP